MHHGDILVTPDISDPCGLVIGTPQKTGFGASRAAHYVQPPRTDPACFPNLCHYGHRLGHINRNQPFRIMLCHARRRPGKQGHRVFDEIPPIFQHGIQRLIAVADHEQQRLVHTLHRAFCSFNIRFGKPVFPKRRRRDPLPAAIPLPECKRPKAAHLGRRPSGIVNVI